MIWHEFKCDAYSRGLGIDLTSPVVEMLVDNDLTAYETAADFKSGKPVTSPDTLLNKCRVLKFDTIKNSLSNASYLKDKTNNLLEIQKILKARKNGSKTFFSKFDLINPFKLVIVYGKILMIQVATNNLKARESSLENSLLNSAWIST